MGEKVKIVWNGSGGELDSVVVTDDGDGAIREALIEMLGDNIVSPGDSFVIESAGA